MRRRRFLGLLGCGVLATASGWFLTGCATGGPAGSTGIDGAERTDRPSTGPATTTGPTSPATPEALAAVAQLREGMPLPVTEPGSGREAYLVRRGDRVVMRSSTCTHQGCIVRWAPADDALRCPCHGATYDAWTGEVLSGPAPTPLPSIAIRVTSGRVYLA